MSKKKTADEMTAEPVSKASEPTFTKEQLVNSKLFKHRRYALAACLDDDKKYTIKEAEKLLNKLKGEK